MTHLIRRLAAGSMLAASCSLAAGAVASTALASPALAATGPAAHAAARPAAAAAGLGVYSTWEAARAKVGFAIRRPGWTAGLRRAEPVLVERCLAKGHLAQRNVMAVYGSWKTSLLVLEQNNAGVPCLPTAVTKKLGTYRVGRVRATLRGECGMAKMLSCQRRDITMYLTWRQFGVYHMASSWNEPRTALLGLARDMHHIS